ncbi:MAG: HEPN domain-containing protein [Bryobacteraceae bacterium]|jgi:HEPN domain-containing protein
MSAPPEAVEILRQWVRKAEHDLEAARWIMTKEEGSPYDTVCFHCQQAAEKYLKRLLTLLTIEAPRTHNLAMLAELLPDPYPLSEPPESLASMNPYAVDIRYTDDLREPQRADALRALDLAQAVRADVRKVLPAEALREV